MITILGAGGVISNELAQTLAAENQPMRMVSRKGSAVHGAQPIAADITDRDQTMNAVAGSDVVCLVAGLKYDRRVWAEAWPRIMTNAIEACKRANARLLFFDNVYMYGRAGVMTETTPYNPCSVKGEVRAKIATMLENEWKAGFLTAMIARSADFYGPGAPNGLPNTLVFDPLSKGQSASCLVSDAFPHSYTYTPDAAKGVAQLLRADTAWNQTWHLPTAPNPPTGKEFIIKAAAALGVAPKYRVLGKAMVRIFGWFNPIVGEIHEMLYQNDAPYIFDSSKYAAAFDFAGTPYDDGIAATAVSYKR
jgi:nucleoside-diphosphate-sugar epimerase